MNFKNYIVNSDKNVMYQYLGIKRYKFKYLGKNVRICSPGFIACTENMIIQDNVFIGRDFYIEAQSHISIGSGTMIGPRCTMISGSHYYDGDDLKAVPYDNRMKNMPITIGSNVWIAANVIISPGTTIGDGAVIGGGASVYGEIPPNSIVVNSGYKILRERNVQRYNELVNKNAVYNVIYSGKRFEYLDNED